MTSIDPSHFPWLSRSSSRSQGEAVHTSIPAKKRRVSSDSLDSLDGIVPVSGKKSRARIAIPALPDLRFEQSFLLSILPFLKPVNEEVSANSQGKKRAELEDQAAIGEDKAEVFYHPVTVRWRALLHVTFRDQILWPLAQGMAWGAIGMLAALFMRWRFRQPKDLWWSTVLHHGLTSKAARFLGGGRARYHVYA